MPANRTIDLDLLDAIRAKDAIKTQELIKSGANPFVTIYYKTGIQNSILLSALKSNSPKVLHVILQHALKIRTVNFEPIDLTKPIEINSDSKQMHLLQYAALHGSSLQLEQLFSYAKETGQDKHMHKALNGFVTSTRTDGKRCMDNFGERLVNTFNRDLMRDFAFPKDNSTPTLKALNDFFNTWYACEDENKFSNQEVVEVVWKGPLSNLELLLSKGLDVKTVAAKVESIAKWSKNPADWQLFSGSMVAEGVTIEPERHETEDGKPYLYLTTINSFGKCPVKFKVVLDFDPMLKIVQRYVSKAREANPVVAEFRDEVRKDMGDLKSKVDNLSERLLADTRESLIDNENGLHCFNKIYQAIHAHLLAHQVASTKMFSLKATDKSALMVKSAATALNFASQAAGMMGGVVAGIAGACLLEIQQHQIRKKNQAIIKATESIDINKLSIHLAALITHRAMQSYGSNIKEKAIDSFITTIKSELINADQFENQAEFTAYLFQEATGFLPEVAARSNSDHSHPSTSTGSGKDSPKTAMVYGFKKAKQSAGSGSNESGEALVAIQDMMPAKRRGFMSLVCA